MALFALVNDNGQIMFGSGDIIVDPLFEVQTLLVRQTGSCTVLIMLP